MGEASTSKAKGKRAGCWKRKKGKAKTKTVVVEKDAKSAPIALVGMGKGKKRMGTQQQPRANDIYAHCREKGHWNRDCPNLSSDQGMFVVEVLQRSRKLSNDEVVLRLGDGKFVAAEAVGIINLVVNDRVRLELKDCYFVPSMIKNIISITLLDNTSFEFLINKNCFYLMKDGSSHLLGKLNNGLYLLQREDDQEARFKEFRLEVENQTGRKIKTLLSDRGGEYLSREFIDYLKQNGIVSQRTTPGTPRLNGVAERRNRTLLDMIRSMSFTELPLSFWRYALETAPMLLDIALSKIVAQTPYQRYGTASLLRTSPLECHSLLRGMVFLGVTSQLDNDPKTYREVMSDIDPKKWLEAMKFEMDSMSSNQVWTLVDRPKGVRPVGCKWVYKRKIGADGEVTTFKARLVAKGYTQRPGVDFEETFSPVAMAKSIWIMLAIVAWYDYEIWQMDWKMAFPNGFVEEEIYMDQPEGFTIVGEEQKNDFDPCVYKKVSGSLVVFLVLYVDDILLIGNDIKMLGDTEAWLSTQFSMKDLGEASYIIGIKIFRDRSKRILGMTQNSYVEKVLKRFKITLQARIPSDEKWD
ncbi:UNVERIFIED_CONTAM: Retrovirus-related Pol polyprotein from transposon TNT 1-94 [Sesamum calycinum]|uniref:Retrovirus-related Pol polyprotein from transposon TNT 1-94 n=1 Tax=Sesamum calycinum TaxID=2727403 RepID=A0AAW2K110_9LAMI